MGALVLVHDLRTLLDESAQPVAESAPVSPPVPHSSDPPKPQEPVLSDGVLHALNCTYEDYRNDHFDECVEDPSRIYLRPNADPDDTGHVIYDTPVLYAHLAPEHLSDAAARIERGMGVVTDDATISLR